MGKKIWSAFATALLICLSKASFASIEKSARSLMYVNNTRFLKLLQAYGAAPEDLKAKQVIVLIRCGAAYVDITTIAPSGTNPHELSQLCLDSIHGTDALYSQTDEVLVSHVGVSYGRFFQNDRAWTFDLNKCLSVFRDAGWKVYGGVKISTDANGTVAAPAILSSATNATYTISALEQRPIRLEAKLSAPELCLPILVVFGPLSALIFSLLSAQWILKQKEMDIGKRRKLYRSLVRYPVFGAIVICLPTSMFAILGGHLMAMTDLWAGSYSNSAMFIPIIALTAPFSILSAVPLTRIEARLFSDVPDKVDFKRAEVVNLTPETSRQRLYWVLGIGAVGVAVYFGSMRSSVPSGGCAIVRFVGLALIVLANPIIGFALSRSTTRRKNPTRYEHPFVSHVMELARKANCPLESVSIIEPNDQAQGITVNLIYSRLSVTREAVNTLSASALDFGIMHAMQVKTMRSMAYILALCLPLSGAVVFALSQFDRTGLPAKVMILTMPALLLVLMPYANWVRKRESTRQLRDTLKILPNRDAAREWFETARLGFETTTRTKRQEAFRTSQLRELDEICTEMGL